MPGAFFAFWGVWAVVFGFVALASGAGLGGALVAIVAAGAAAVWHDSFKDVEAYATAVIVLVLMGAWMAHAF